MNIVIEMSVPAADFQLGRTVEDVDAGGFELERMVPTTESIIPFFWVHETDPDALEAALEADEDVVSIQLLTALDDRALFRVEWTTDINGLVQSIIDHDAVILEAIGTTDRWTFQLRFADNANASSFRADCTDAGVQLDIHRIYQPSDTEIDTNGLTPAQRETLLTALEAGYFAIPRQISQVELADTLGISDQALSERLRRAQTTLLTTLLLPEQSPE